MTARKVVERKMVVYARDVVTGHRAVERGGGRYALILHSCFLVSPLGGTHRGETQTGRRELHSRACQTMIR